MMRKAVEQREFKTWSNVLNLTKMFCKNQWFAVNISVCWCFDLDISQNPKTQTLGVRGRRALFLAQTPAGLGGGTAASRADSSQELVSHHGGDPKSLNWEQMPFSSLAEPGLSALSEVFLRWCSDGLFGVDITLFNSAALRPMIWMRTHARLKWFILLREGER